MAIKFVVAKEHRTGYSFEHICEGTTAKERMYIRKKTLKECNIDPAKGITIKQYEEEDGEAHDPR